MKTSKHMTFNQPIADKDKKYLKYALKILMTIKMIVFFKYNRLTIIITNADDEFAY